MLKNRIYRIHTDDCHKNDERTNHFLRECPYSQSILFIANNTDSIQLPLLQNQQALCHIVSTNDNSGNLLDVDGLKEEMSFDFNDADNKVKKQMKFRKWFSVFQEYGLNTQEPLVELYIYNFLSERSSEAYGFYQKDVSKNPYYQKLLNRLKNTYANSTFTTQYTQELTADTALLDNQETNTYKWEYFLYGGLAVFMFQICYYRFAKKSKKLHKKAKRALTTQEHKIFEAIYNGKTNKEIAQDFFISISTVKTHINTIYKKLGIRSREEITNR